MEYQKHVQTSRRAVTVSSAMLLNKKQKTANSAILIQYTYQKAVAFRSLLFNLYYFYQLSYRKYHAIYLYKYLIFLLFLNPLVISSFYEIFFQLFACIISFLYSFILISIIFAYFYLSFRIINFFSSSIFRLLHQISRLFIFYTHSFQDCLYSDYSLMIYDYISEIISMVTMFGFPFFIFYLFYFILYSIYFIFLLFVTVFQCVFKSFFQFYTVLAVRDLHSSFILASCDLVFSIFSSYFSWFFKKLRAFYCYFLTFRNEVLSASKFRAQFSKALTAFYFSMIEDSSQTYQFSFLTLNIQFLSQSILISCILTYNFLVWVSSSIFSSRLIPYFFFYFPLEIIKSICSASSITCFFNFMFCSINFYRFIYLLDQVLVGDSRQGLF